MHLEKKSHCLLYLYFLNFNGWFFVSLHMVNIIEFPRLYTNKVCIVPDFLKYFSLGLSWLDIGKFIFVYFTYFPYRFYALNFNALFSTKIFRVGWSLLHIVYHILYMAYCIDMAYIIKNALSYFITFVFVFSLVSYYDYGQILIFLLLFIYWF